MIAYQNNLYIVEPNHGQLLEVSPDGAVRQVIDISAPLGHIVPTSVIVDADRLWVGNLGLFPITTGTEKLYQISARGCVSDYLEGFTSIVGLASNGQGSIYVFEFSAADRFPAPGKVRVLRVTDGLIEVVLSGLAVPTSITIGPDGALYISDLGAAPAPAGRIVRYTPPPLGRATILSSSARSAVASGTCARPEILGRLN
jgi:sugar lactone lactonase YvrE